MRDLVAAGWIGPIRAVLLGAVALAAVLDLVTFVALVARDDAPGPDGPDEVARTVVQAVADDDCSDVADLLDDSDLPPVLTSCLQGVPSPVQVDDVTVVGTEVTDDTAAVTVGARVDGAAARVVVELRRTGGDWLVTTIVPA